MWSRGKRWLITGALALVIATSLAIGGGQPSMAHGADPTPTPLNTNSHPGGSSGGGGGG
jgi:hypothetical protein